MDNLIDSNEIIKEKTDRARQTYDCIGVNGNKCFNTKIRICNRKTSKQREEMGLCFSCFREAFSNIISIQN